MVGRRESRGEQKNPEQGPDYGAGASDEKMSARSMLSNRESRSDLRRAGVEGSGAALGDLFDAQFRAEASHGL